MKVRSRSMFAGLCTALVLLGSSVPVMTTQRGPVNDGPGTSSAARRYLEGRWGLVSFEIFPHDAQPIEVKGSGTLTYDAFGNMDIQIRVDQATAMRLGSAGIPTDRGVLSTTGRTVIDMQARTLTYYIEGQPPLGAPSGALALNRPRYWQVDGHILTLTTKGADGRPLSIARWEKLVAAE